MMQETMGASTAAAIDGWVVEASRAGGVASLVGASLTLFAASRFTTQLRSALNQVWNVDVSLVEGFKSSLKDYLKRRVFAFVMVLASGPILICVFLSRALLMGVGAAIFPQWALTGAVVQALQLLFSLVLVAVASAVVFRFIPDTRVGWRAISRGALLTSALFNTGNLLVGLYLGKASVGAAYGAAGSLVVVLLWLYFSAEMFLYGAEFTQVYASHYGRGPSEEEEHEVERAQRNGKRAAATS
jgi:membrane protein